MKPEKKAAAFCFILLACLATLAEKASAQGVTFARTDYLAGTDVLSVITGDFNGDGKLDIATANAGSNDVSILLGVGDGTFAAKMDFAIGQSPRWVAAGDFNGDNKLDLVTANFEANAVSILLGNGDGTFGSATNFGAGNGPLFVVAADFNSDARLDLAVANQSADSISVLLGNGDGTFGAKADFLTGAMPEWLIVVDFNEDAKLDLASANPGSHTVSVLLGNGNGTFAAKADFATGRFPRSLVAADFRKMMKLDLATANTRDSTVSILLGRRDGTFDPRTDLGTDTGPLAVTAADFDNDGKPDLLTSNVGTYFYFQYYYLYAGTQATISLLRGKGDGTFEPRTDFFVGISIFLPCVAAGDFNRDGRIDVVVATGTSNSVTVLLQSAEIAFSASSLAFPENQPIGTPSPPQTVTVSSTGAVNLVIGAVALAGSDAGDFNVESDTCSGSAVSPGSNCQIRIGFTPTASGFRTALLRIPNNAQGNPHEVGLSSGVPADFSVMPAAGASASLTINAGQGANFLLSLAVTGGFTGMGTISCSVAIPAGRCLVSPATANLGSAPNIPVTVSVSTTARSTLAPSRWPQVPLRVPVPAWILSALLALALASLYRRNEVFGRPRAWPANCAPVLALLLVVLLSASCGGSNTAAPKAPQPGTPPGTYAVNVSVVSGGMTRTLTLDLTVR
jgi:hypothetical protein